MRIIITDKRKCSNRVITIRKSIRMILLKLEYDRTVSRITVIE